MSDKELSHISRLVIDYPDLPWNYSLLSSNCKIDFDPVVTGSLHRPWTAQVFCYVDLNVYADEIINCTNGFVMGKFDIGEVCRSVIRNKTLTIDMVRQLLISYPDISYTMNTITANINATYRDLLMADDIQWNWKCFCSNPNVSLDFLWDKIPLDLMTENDFNVFDTGSIVAKYFATYKYDPLNIDQTEYNRMMLRMTEIFSDIVNPMDSLFNNCNLSDEIIHEYVTKLINHNDFDVSYLRSLGCNPALKPEFVYNNSHIKWFDNDESYSTFGTNKNFKIQDLVNLYQLGVCDISVFASYLFNPNCTTESQNYMLQMDYLPSDAFEDYSGTWEFMMQHPEITFSAHGVCTSNYITPDIIEDNPSFDWQWTWLIYNKNLTYNFISKHIDDGSIEAEHITHLSMLQI
jgi:hypothetical protein